MAPIETTQEQAESHFRVAASCYTQAEALFNDGPDKILPHTNPEFRLARNQVQELLDESDNNINYAEDFAFADVDSIRRLREKNVDLRKKLRESRK